jgi:predicted RNase H-like HicB family nuclease
MRSILEKTSSGYSAYIEGLDGVAATGRTVQEVKRNISEAFLMHIDGLKEDGELPDFLDNPENRTLTFNIDIETFFSWYSGIITKAGISKIANINQSLVSQYAMGIKKPGPKQRRKIEEKLHEFGKELIEISF